MITVVRTWHDVQIKIENPVGFQVEVENGETVIKITMSHKQADMLAKLIGVTDEDDTADE